MSQLLLSFRPATRNDVSSIVRMLSDDLLGAKRERYEQPLPATYYDAYQAIQTDPNNELIVAQSGEAIVGVLQLTFIPYLTYQGGWRALIEGVRVASPYRGQGVGGALFRWAIARAKERECVMIQLTTDKARPDAKRFYEGLGFKASHEGMKLHLRSVGAQ